MTHSASGRRDPEPVRIAVDLLGGDHAPAVVVDGALRACGADPNLRLLLVGTRPGSDEAMGVFGAELAERVATLVVERSVAMTDPVARGADPQTSIGAAMRTLAADEVDAVVSAGSSGASVAAAVLALGRINEARRPALAAILPGRLVLLDVGAGMQADARDLVQHAQLGSQYAQQMLDIAKPRVGLLSVGSEPGKGDRLRRAADAALRLHPLPGSYVGPVEGQDVVSSARVDVVVTDGFTGNILLKGLEAALATLAHPPADIPRAGVLLGVAGTVVVCHGAADADDIASGIALAARLVRGEPALPPERPGAGSGVGQAQSDPSGDHGPASLAEVHP